jgi:malonyl-CoA O-methyltransferase
MQQEIDKQLIGQRFLAGMKSYDQNASVQKHMAKVLTGMFLNISGISSFDKILEIGCGTGFLTKAILDKIKVNYFLLNDIVLECNSLVSSLAKSHPATNFHFIHQDAEELSNLPDTFELILSNAAFQWLTNIEIFLNKLYGVLSPGGFLVFTTFGKNNLNEINLIEKKSLHYYTIDELCLLINKHFNILDLGEENIKLSFDTPKDVLKHLKHTGTKGIQKERWTKKHLQEFEDNYYKLFTKNNKVILTYNPIYIIAQRR